MVSDEQTYSIKEALKKPFQGVKTRVDILPIKVFLQFGQKFGKDSVMLLLKTQQFRKARNEKA